MVAFTVIMGNAFAAFPVITAGIGSAVADQSCTAPMRPWSDRSGMLTGYCGTCSRRWPPTQYRSRALLELDDSNGVIRAAVANCTMLLVVNLALMMWLAFR